MCELFEKESCIGCVGLDPQYDIDKNKKICPYYIEWKKKFNEGEQIKWNLKK